MSTTSASASAARARSWSAFHAGMFADFAVPRQWELDVAGFLFERGYHSAAAAEVLAHAHLYGSVCCCPALQFDEKDRDAVEARLPDCPEGEWARYPGTWVISE